jgi:Xaa-Pro aminopeptidase
MADVLFPTIPEAEFTRRMAAFRDSMAARGLDLVVAYSNMLDPSAVRWFSDFFGINESAALVIPREADPILCSGQACHEWSRHKSKVREIRILPEVGEVSGVEYDIAGQLDFADLFREVARGRQVKSIGIIGDLIFPHEIHRKLQAAFPSASLSSAEMLMYELRMRKSEAEIACIRKACQIISEAFAFTAARVAPGVTELDIQADLEGQMLRLGAEAYCNSFSPMIPSGIANSNLCMNRNTLRKVKEGEIIDLQAGALYEGYNGVICTPLVLGKVPGEIRAAVQVAYEAIQLMSRSMRPGAVSTELYRIYGDFLEKKGYRKYSPYGSVHSLGMLECETPFFSAHRAVPLAENMTVAVDVYFKGLPWGSFRIEDTFLIRGNGAEQLTTFNPSFIPKTFS